MTDQEIRNTDEAEDNFYSLRDILMMMTANWKWFVLAIAVCLVFAGLKIYTTPKVYTRSAAILIKDSRRGNVTSSLFSDISSARIIPNVENEMYLLGSQRLMMQVVKDLKLDVWYSTREGLRKRDLYGTSPIEAVFPDIDDKRTAGFSAVLTDDDRVELSDFYIRGRDDVDKKNKVRCTLGDTVSTPIGRMVVMPTLYYSRYDKSKKPVIDVRKAGVEGTAISFMSKLTPSLPNELASVIMLSINDVNTRRAEAVLNTLMKVYQEDVVADKRQVSDVSRRFIDDRLRVIEAELAAEDKRVLGFKESNRLIDFREQASLALNESSRYKSGIYDIENQIILVTYLRDYLEGGNSIELIPANVGITDQYLNTLISEYNTEVLHRNELLRSSNERNPAIVSLTSLLTAQFEGIMASIGNLLQQLDISLAQARTRERLAMGAMSSAPGQESEMTSLARQQTVKEQLYLYLLNKKEESDLSSVVIDSDARIVEYAYGSGVPVSPKPMRIIILALLAGCVVPFVVLLLINILNTTVRSRKDVEDRLSAPFFGEIPYMPRKKGSSEIIVKDEGRDPVSEAFRILRSNMSFMSVSGGMKVILVTSSNIGSGKTFFSLNMAAALAIAGKKVVVIDGDMRKRTLTRKYGNLESNKGLSRCLSDSSVSGLSAVVMNPAGTGVDMIFAGIQPPNPAELLMSGRLDTLIEELGSHYDYILIDSVPAFMVADAAITGRIADHTVYVIREGLMDRRQLPDIEKLYLSGRFPNMMVVLNGIRESRRKYAYGYGYGYGNGSYGYENTENGTLTKLRKLRRG